ncbi:MAG TPA: Rossmann-like and DUF2520 domain-containing protein [Burkholderiaceae bacterium]|nr:Rossmann-like and DUF2520 domain-containing protein [Burkholderiaceae bacterium]
MTHSLSIIGGGKVGRTLGRLWSRIPELVLNDVLNRSLASAQDACDFIGAGRAIDAYSSIRRSDVYLIATPDDMIEQACNVLAASGKLNAASIVFHCSGAKNTAALHAAIEHGAAVASVHPIRSFASPEQLINSFSGTYCGAEGDSRALSVLSEMFGAIGGTLVAINSERKVLYHAAAVFASNYLVTLLDLAQHAYVEAGVAPDTALQLMEPLVRATVDNVFRLGPAIALTGPIARGDMATVRLQQEAVTDWQAKYGDLYRDFTKLTMELAARRKLEKN